VKNSGEGGVRATDVERYRAVARAFFVGDPHRPVRNPAADEVVQPEVRVVVVVYQRLLLRVLEGDAPFVRHADPPLPERRRRRQQAAGRGRRPLRGRARAAARSGGRLRRRDRAMTARGSPSARARRPRKRQARSAAMRSPSLLLRLVRPCPTVSQRWRQSFIHESYSLMWAAQTRSFHRAHGHRTLAISKHHCVRPDFDSYCR